MEFFTASRVLIVAGKGGVGKTTVAAVLGRAATRLGLTALILEVEGKSGMAAALGMSRLDYESTVAPPPTDRAGHGDAVLHVRQLSAEQALTDYLDQRGLTRMLRRLQGQRLLDVLASSTPGVNDLLVLGKVKQLERAPAADVIIVDAPAAGHAITFLRSAAGVLDSVDGGPVREQAHEVDQMLRDPARCQVLLVTLAEETPVNELIDTAYQLEDEIGIKLGPIVVNALTEQIDGLDVPAVDAARAAVVDLTEPTRRALDAAASFRRQRCSQEAEQLQRLVAELPLDQLHLPSVGARGIGSAETSALADHLLGQLGSLHAPIDLPDS